MSRQFKHYIKNDCITFKYALGPSEEPNREFHSFNEIILFLEGDAELISESIHTKIQPNTLIVVPKEVYHQVVLRGTGENYLRCTLHFPDIPHLPLEALNSDKVISLLPYSTDFQFLFQKLIENAKAPNKTSKLVLSPILTLILSEITSQANSPYAFDLQNESILSAIEYINLHIEEKITLSSIAKATNLSVSSLSHTFKKEMNISVYNYITKKRIVMAHQKINSGMLASSAALECGFNDYSGFYKQYIKLFGHAPTHSKPMNPSKNYLVGSMKIPKSGG